MALLISIISILFGSGLALLLYALCVEPRWYRINRHKIHLRRPLGKAFKVLHLSDIHFAKEDPSLGRFFDRLAKEPCDLVVITGDIIDCPEGIPFCVESLKKLRPTYGTYAVFGNHDYYDYRLTDVAFKSTPGHGFPRELNRPDLLEQAMKKEGIHVLKNETAEIRHEGHSVLIHGIDDPVTGRANVRKALQSYDPHKINLLLTHTIDVFLDIGEDEMDVSFSGHSHGGQVCAPFYGPIIYHTMLGRTYASGIRRMKGTVCSISRGMGASRYFFLRFLAPPEAILLEMAGPHA